jgi:chaperonin GroES
MQSWPEPTSTLGRILLSGALAVPEWPQDVPVSGTNPIRHCARDENAKLVPLDVKEKDRILFGKWSGAEVKLDGEELLIMNESDIMGIIEGQPAAKRKAA